MTDDYLGNRLPHNAPSLKQVGDWLAEKGYSWEAETVREACITVGSLVAEVERYKRIASKAIREQIDVRKDERERCAKISLDTYSDKDRMKYVHDTYTSGFSDCKLKIHRAIMETSND